MDHVLDRIDLDLEISFDEFKVYYSTGKYKKFSDVPNYYQLKALIDSGNVLRKYLGIKTLSIKELWFDYTNQI